MGSELADLALLFLFCLHLSRHRLSIYVENIVTMLAYYAFGLVYVLVSVAVGVAPLLAKGVMKTTVVSVIALFVAAVYVLSSVVPFIGRWTAPVESTLRDQLYSRGLESQVNRFRSLLVDITAENKSREPKFETVDEFRDELETVKEAGKRRLERGETVLSLGLGAALLGGQAAGVDVLRASLYGIGVLFVVEVWLLMIAGSVLYRATVLEMLSYPRDVELESVKEFDAALSYQKAVTQANFVQILLLLVAVVQALGNYREDLVRSGVEEAHGGLNISEVVAFLWHKIQNQDTR